MDPRHPNLAHRPPQIPRETRQPHGACSFARSSLLRKHLQSPVSSPNPDAESDGVGKGTLQSVTPGRGCSANRRRLSGLLPGWSLLRHAGWRRRRIAIRRGRSIVISADTGRGGREHGSGRRYTTSGVPPVSLARDGNAVMGRHPPASVSSYLSGRSVIRPNRGFSCHESGAPRS